MEKFPEFPGVRSGDELTGVITHLTSIATQTGRRQRSADEPLVRWLLEAGLLAIERTYLSHDSADEVLGYDSMNALLDAISVDEIMKEFKRLAQSNGIDVGNAHRSRIISRWEYVANYQADLIAYVYRPAIHKMRMREIEREQVPTLLRLPFGEVVQILSKQESTTVPETPIIRLQTALPIIFPNDRAIRRASANLYRQQVAAWAGIYRFILSEYSIELATDEVSLEDIATMFNIVVEGGFIRRCSDPGLGELSDGGAAELKMIRLLIAQLAGLPWESLKDRTCTE